MTKSREILEYLMQPSLGEFRNHIRLTTTEMDADLMSKLKAASANAEHVIGEIIALSDFTLADTFSHSVTFPERPFVGVRSVKVDGQEVPQASWTVNGSTLTFADDVEGTAMVIVYRAGREDVEYDIRNAILLHAAALFNNPVDSVETLPKASFNLLRPYRNWELKDGKQD